MIKEDLIKNFKNFGVQVFIFLILILILFYFGIFKKTCLDDSCFEKSLSKCSSVQYVKQKNNNLYTYSILNSIMNECKINIKLEKVAPGSDPDIKTLEGKSMYCKIPKSILTTTNLDNLDNVLQYCHGELKEGILELILKRMYSLVIGNLDEIIKQSKEFLKNV